VNGTIVGHTYDPATALNPESFNGGKSLSGYMRAYSFIPSSSTPAAYAKVILRKFDTTPGQSDSWMFVCRAQVERVGEMATGPGPWSPGPGAAKFGENIYGTANTEDISRNAVNDFYTVTHSFSKYYTTNSQLADSLSMEFDIKIGDSIEINYIIEDGVFSLMAISPSVYFLGKGNRIFVTIEYFKNGVWNFSKNDMKIINTPPMTTGDTYNLPTNISSVDLIATIDTRLRVTVNFYIHQDYKYYVNGVSTYTGSLVSGVSRLRASVKKR
jgi:hypothetical protein